MYIEWNGNITPCTFNPYVVGNVNEIFNRQGSLAEVLNHPFMKHIREWQTDYGFGKEKDIQNWITPCPIRDHYRILRNFIEEDKPKPLDEAAKEALSDGSYKNKMIEYDKSLSEVLDPVWEGEYGYKIRNKEEL